MDIWIYGYGYMDIRPDPVGWIRPDSKPGGAGAAISFFSRKMTPNVKNDIFSIFLSYVTSFFVFGVYSIFI